jgi:hypothetical protein
MAGLSAGTDTKSTEATSGQTPACDLPGSKPRRVRLRTAARVEILSNSSNSGELSIRPAAPMAQPHTALGSSRLSLAGIAGSRWEIAPDLLVIAVSGLAARLALLPFTGIDTSDATFRTWLALRWLAHPRFITSGVWLPLHFYLSGIAIYLFKDQVYAPIAMNIGFSISTAIVMYLYARNEGASRPACFAVGSVFALYPIAIRNSLMPLSEPSFVFFMAMTLLFLSKTRADTGTWRTAVLAAVWLNLASMIRFEAWIVMPFLCLVLYKKIPLMTFFAATSLIYPIIWMTGSALDTGNPLNSFQQASDITLQLQGRAAELSTWMTRVAAVLTSASVTFAAATRWISALCVVGIGVAIATRSRRTIWILPLAGLALAMASAVARGSLRPRLFYAEPIVLFLLPFLMELFPSTDASHARARRSWWAAWSITAILLATVVGTVLELRTGDWRVSGILNFLSPIRPVSRFPNQTMADEIIALSSQHIFGKEEGLVSDFYDWSGSSYVVLRTGLPPDRVFMARGHDKPTDLTELGAFVDRHPAGVLLLHLGSRFRDALRFDGEQIVVDGRRVKLDKVGEVPWPALTDAAIIGNGGEGRGGLAVFRYQRR